MAMLIVHKPWSDSKPRRRSGPKEWIDEFLEFIQQDECPEFVKLEFARVKERAQSKRPEAVASEECYDDENRADIDDDVKDLLSIITTKTMASDPFFNVNDYKINRGLHYDWSQRTTVSTNRCHEAVSSARNHLSPKLYTRIYNADARASVSYIQISRIYNLDARASVSCIQIHSLRRTLYTQNHDKSRIVNNHKSN